MKTATESAKEVYLIMTTNEQKSGYPKAMAVLAIASDGDLEFTRRIYQRASFGHNIHCQNARECLALIDAEIKRRR